MGLLDSITALFTPSRQPSAEVWDAIQIAGQMVGPLLWTAPGYPQRLAEPAAQALDYCHKLVQAIPGPVDINRQAFSADPLVHALFGSAADIDEMLGRSQVLHEFMQKNVVLGDFYALLGMRRKQKRQFGMALEQDRVVSDVPQTMLYFGDHTLVDPAAQVEAARQQLQMAMFRGLVESYALHVRKLLEESKPAAKPSIGWRDNAASDIPHAAQSRQLPELDSLLRAHAGDLRPTYLMEQLVACFSAPAPFLRLDPVNVAVDRMGVVASSDSEQATADKLCFVELTSRDNRQWVVVLVRIGYREAMDAIRDVKQATRYIVI